MNYFVTGIDTDSGKTLVSAILCEALSADYWKPIQSGLPKDSDTVQSLVSNPNLKVHPESYLFKTPASPHAAAKIENITISLEQIQLPKSQNRIVIEGAGGCLVPLNDKDFIVDLILKFSCEVILVADLYLGSINHTLLTLEALRNRNVPCKGIVFNGEANEQSQSIIMKHAQLPTLLHIARHSAISRDVVLEYASIIRNKLE